MVYNLNLNVASEISLDVADQKLVVLDTPSTFTITLDGGDVLTVPTGRTGTINRADGQPLGRIKLNSPGGGAAGSFARLFVNDIYCVALY